MDQELTEALALAPASGMYYGFSDGTYAFKCHGCPAENNLQHFHVMGWRDMLLRREQRGFWLGQGQSIQGALACRLCYEGNAAIKSLFSAKTHPSKNEQVRYSLVLQEFASVSGAAFVTEWHALAGYPATGMSHRSIDLFVHACNIAFHVDGKQHRNRADDHAYDAALKHERAFKVVRMHQQDQADWADIVKDARTNLDDASTDPMYSKTETPNA